MHSVTQKYRFYNPIVYGIITGEHLFLCETPDSDNINCSRNGIIMDSTTPARHTDEYYMKKALSLAKRAAKIGEVPIGCVIVCNDEIIGTGYNKRKKNKTTLAHAELLAIDKASKKLGDWRLEGCILYVTLEPCQMCAGAIVQARIDRVVIGAMNPKAGCAGSILNLLQMQQFNHQVEITYDVLQENCSTLLSEFFAELRIKLKQIPKTEPVE